MNGKIYRFESINIIYQFNTIASKFYNYRIIENTFVQVDSLTAFTSYKFLLLQCGGTKSLFNEFDIKTKHDSKLMEKNISFHITQKHQFQFQFIGINLIKYKCVYFLLIAPGAVTNHKYYKKDGIVVEWNAPINANGILKYYLIEWTIANQTYSEKIPYQSEIERNTFKVIN